MVELFPEYKKAVQDLLSEEVSPGRIISHKWLDEKLMLDKEDPEYFFQKMSRFQEFRMELLTVHKIHLGNLRGKGYIIIAPEDQTESAVIGTMSDISKSIKKGALYLNNVDIGKLGDSDRKKNADALEKISALKSMFKKERREISKTILQLPKNK